MTGPDLDYKSAKPGLACSFRADRATVLACIRCERPYCPDCLERTDPGLICFECLGLPPPETQRRNEAVREVLTLTGISSAFGLIQILVGPLSWPALLLGAIAGWLMGRRLKRYRRRGTRAKMVAFGAIAVLQGTILAAMVRMSLGMLGILSLPQGATMIQGTVSLVIWSAFYILAGIAAIAWILIRE